MTINGCHNKFIEKLYQSYKLARKFKRNACYRWLKYDTWNVVFISNIFVQLRFIRKKVKLFESNSILNEHIFILYQLLHVTFLLIYYFIFIFCHIVLSLLSLALHVSIISTNIQLLHTTWIRELSSDICRAPTSDIVIRLSVFLGMTCLLNRQLLILFNRIRFQFRDLGEMLDRQPYNIYIYFQLFI